MVRAKKVNVIILRMRWLTPCLWRVRLLPAAGEAAQYAFCYSQRRGAKESTCVRQTHGSWHWGELARSSASPRYHFEPPRAAHPFYIRLDKKNYLTYNNWMTWRLFIPNYCRIIVMLWHNGIGHWYKNSPVNTCLADGSARSTGVLPSVFLIAGSALCCRRTAKWRQKHVSDYLHCPHLLQ